MTTFAKKFKFWVNELMLVDDSYPRAWYKIPRSANGFHYQLDWSAVRGTGVVKLTEVQKYARRKFQHKMQQSNSEQICPLTTVRSLSEMYYLFKQEALEMGLSDAGGIPVLAARLAGYADLSESQRYKLRSSSALFEEIEEKICQTN